MAISGALGAQREAELPQGTVRYRELGEGPVLLFMHGVPENGDGFRHVVPPLANRFRCVVPDWPWGMHELPLNPGADLSPPGLVTLVRDFCEELGLKDVTFVGSGGGGTIAQIFTAEHPGLVDRLVLLTGDALDHFPARALGGFKLLAKAPPAVWVFVQLGRIGPIQRFWFGLGSRAAPGDGDLLRDSYLEPMLASAGVRRDLRRTIGQFAGHHSMSAARRLAELDKPTLLIWSDADRFFHLSDAEEMARLWPHARLEVLEHDRALLARDRPDEVVRLVRGFVPAP